MSSQTPHRVSQSRRGHQHRIASSSFDSPCNTSLPGDSECSPWAVTHADLSQEEKLLLNVLEHVGRDMVPPRSPSEPEVRSRDIEGVLCESFSNPVFLYGIAFLDGYEEENRALVHQAVLFRDKILAGLQAKLGGGGSGLKKEKLFDRLGDEEFAAWMRVMDGRQIASVVGSSSHSPWNIPKEVAVSDEKVHNVALASSKIARLLRAVDLRNFLRGLSETGLPDGAGKSDEKVIEVARTYTALGVVIQRLAKVIIPEEVIKDMITPFSALSDMVAAAEESFLRRVTKARNLELERQEQMRELEEEQRQRRLEERAAEERARKEAEERRITEAQRIAAEKLREFHTSFREVPLPPGIEKMLGQLELGHGIPINLHPHSARVARVFRDIHQHLVDYRGDRPDVQGDAEIEKLARILFSPLTIGLVAETAGLQAEKQLGVKLPSKTPDVQHAKALFEILSNSAAARRVIHTLFDQSDGIVVAAVLLLPLQEAKNYVSSMSRLIGGSAKRIPVGMDARTQIQESRSELAVKMYGALEKQGVERRAQQALEIAGDTEFLSGAQQGENSKHSREWSISPSIAQHINPEAFHAWVEDQQVYVAPLANPKFAFSLPAKKLRDEESFIVEYQKRVARCLALLEVDTLRSTLIEKYGFTLLEPEATGGSAVMRHVAYEINESLPADEEHWGKKLSQLQDHFSQCEMSWDVLLQEAAMNGVEVVRGEAGSFLKKSSGEEVRLSDNRFIPLAKMQEVVDLIQHSARETSVQLQRAAREERRRENVKTLLEEHILPQPGEEVLVLDASVFLRLQAPQSGGDGTWLDLLTCLSKLPNIRILVPASVADLELGGEIFPFEADAPTSIDGRRRSSYDAVRGFFSRACRLQFQDGEGLGVAVKNPHQATPRICIVETSEDRKVFGRLTALMKETEGNPIQRHTRLHTDIYHQGVGDDGIESLLRCAPFPNHTTVITDDVKFSKNLEKCVGDRPISTCTTGTLLREIWNCRRIEPFNTLEWGATSHFYDIVKEIVAGTATGEGEKNFIFEYSHLGRRVSHDSPRVYTMQTIIRQSLDG